MKVKKMSMVFIAVVSILASACSNDIAGPEVSEPEMSDTEAGVSRSPYWRLESWENVKLTWVGMNWTETTSEYKVTVRGGTLVRNLAYHKVVAIRYTTDGWKTWKEISARYAQTGQDNSEFWNFESPVFTFKKAYAQESFTSAVRLNFDFAIRYTVNGKTYWDSNKGRNYHLDASKTYISNY